MRIILSELYKMAAAKLSQYAIILGLDPNTFNDVANQPGVLEVVAAAADAAQYNIVPGPSVCVLTTLASFAASPGSPFDGIRGYGIAYGNGRWVDVRQNATGTNILYSSDPSVSWAISPGLPFGSSRGGGFAYGVAYGNGNWVAVGRNWVAVGSPVGNNILHSIDPTAGWTASSGEPFGVNGTGRGIAYGNGLWVAVGTASDGSDPPINSGIILYSTNPSSSWLTSPGNPFGSSVAPAQGGRGIAYGNGLWVAVGRSFDGSGNILYSTNPSGGWLTSPGQPFSTNGYGNGVAYGNGLWVAVGKYGDMLQDSPLLYSTNPAAGWLPSPGNSFGSSGNGNGVAYANGLWVAVGSTQVGNGIILYSTNPIDGWNSMPTVPNTQYYGVAYGGGKWVITGASGSGKQTNDIIIYSVAAC